MAKKKRSKYKGLNVFQLNEILTKIKADSYSAKFDFKTKLEKYETKDVEIQCVKLEKLVEEGKVRMNGINLMEKSKSHCRGTTKSTDNFKLTDSKETSKKKTKSKTETQTQTAKNSRLKVDVEKLIEFLLANKKRGVTRSEVVEFVGVSSFGIIKAKLGRVKNFEKYFAIIKDLRKDKPPVGELCNPFESETAQEKVDNTDNSSKVEDSNYALKITAIEPCDVTEEPNNIETSKSNVKDVYKKKAKMNSEANTFVPKYNLSDIVGIKHKLKNIMFDQSIYSLGLNNFNEILEQVVNHNEKPVLWFSVREINDFDHKKSAKNIFPQQILKLIALDTNHTYTKLIPNKPTGDKLAIFCKDNDITLVSGDPKTIAWCKLYGAKFQIPKYYLQKYPNPFKGKGICGLDTNVILEPQEMVSLVLNQYATSMLSDIQVEETSGSPEIFRYCAYYGRFKKAERMYNYNDHDIVSFYKSNPVDMFYTNDYGCAAFARVESIPYEMYFKKNQIVEECILNKLNSCVGYDLAFYDNIKSGEEIKFDCFIDKKSNGKLHFLKSTDFDISVFDSQNKKRTSNFRFIAVENHDIIVLRKNETILIAAVTNTTEAIGKVLYYGQENKLPKKYNCFKT